MCKDGRKPVFSIITRQAIKSSRETPTHSPEKVHNKPHCERISTRPLCDNRCDIDYSVLNDGYDVETSSPKRRRRHSSRPRSEPTAPRQAAQKKIVETKIHLSSQYNNLDLEKIMDSQYPALQLVPLSGVTNGLIDTMKPSEEESITPVLGTLMVHGVRINKLDLDNIDFEEIATKENKTCTLESESELHSTHLHTQPDDTSSPKNPESPLSEAGNGVTNNLVQDPAQTSQQPNIDSTPKLHGVTNDSEPDKEATQQPVVCKDELLSEETDPMFTQNIQVNKQHETDTVGVNGATKNSTQIPNIDNSSKLKGVTTTDDIQSVTQHKTDTVGVNGITKTQSNSEQNEPETLPDLVLNENSAVNEVNTTEDEDEAAEALLQLSKLDILPEEDTELPRECYQLMLLLYQ